MSGIKNLLKRAAFGAALAACVAAPLLKPSPADAWWRGGWGWHAGWGHPGGWGWHPGYQWGWHVGVGWGWWAPGVVIGVPPVAAPAYPVAAPYHWVPGYNAPHGVWVPPHWGYD